MTAAEVRRLGAVARDVAARSEAHDASCTQCGAASRLGVDWRSGLCRSGLRLLEAKISAACAYIAAREDYEASAAKEAPVELARGEKERP